MSGLACIPESADTGGVVILADCSGSMRGERITRLRRELADLWPAVKGRLISFNWRCGWVAHPNDLPDPEGSTDLEGGLKLAASAWPSECIVISDGLPDDEEAAISAALSLPGTISVIYVGDDEDRRGLAFLQRLANAGGGRFHHCNMSKGQSMLAEMRSILSLPPPIQL